MRLLIAVLLLATALCQGQDATGSFPDVPFQRLSDRTLGALGTAALSIRAADWKHAETKNFVYHFFQSHIAAPVSVEAEFYYSVMAREMGRDTTEWQRKSHIFIFEKADEWAAFQQKGALDPWTGGLHAAGELFIRRDPAQRWQGDTLGHEIAHLVIYRFFGNGVPLWLNEGYADYTASRSYSAFHRARGYRSRPRSTSLPPRQFIPLAELTERTAYPDDPVQVEVFYTESERLVRFLSAADKAGFYVFFDALSKGNRMEAALAKGFGTRFGNLAALEAPFRSYASKDYEASAATPP